MNKEKIKELMTTINALSIPSEIFDYITAFTPKQIVKLENKYSSMSNYLAMLYYLWFIEKYLKSEIADVFEVEPNTIHYQIYNLIWGESQDWEISKRFRDEKLNEGRRLREYAKTLNTDNIPELKELIEKASGYKNKTTFGYGLSEADYLKVLAYYYRIKRMSPVELIPIIGEPLNTIQTRLKKFNLALPHDAGIEGKIERGSQDYTTTIMRGKMATRNEQIKHLNKASKNENVARSYLVNIIYQQTFFDRERYDVVVGCSATGILGAKEIDIPIVVIDLVNCNVHKFALEHNGEVYHNDEDDAVKSELARKRGWLYIPIYYNESNSKSKMEHTIREILNRIKMIISNAKAGD